MVIMSAKQGQNVLFCFPRPRQDVRFKGIFVDCPVWILKPNIQVVINPKDQNLIPQFTSCLWLP